MLFKEIQLQGIKAGTISLAFRRWASAAVKQGSLVKTSIGLVEIINIAIVEETAITAADLEKAGFENLQQLFKSLFQKEGHIYRIEVGYHSADPRVQLRAQQELTEDQFLLLQTQLLRLDRYSKHGSWTMKVLLAIKAHPQLRARDLQTLTGFEKEWLKLHVRKLKNLGLTISHLVGYEISPLGETYLGYLAKAE